MRIIYEKYVYEGYGAQRIATFLNNRGYRARSGKPWHHASIRGMLCNLTYTGILRCGSSRSERLEQLQIIPQELFNAAQEIREARADRSRENIVPLNTRGQSLLVGNIYCAHCGSRLCLTTNTKVNAKGEKVVRLRYICYGKTRKQTECNGQTGYLMYKIDDAVDHLVHDILQRTQDLSRKEIIQSRYQQQLSEQKALVQKAQAEYNKAANELDNLKTEVIKSIQGESDFPKELLVELISKGEENCKTLHQRLTDAQDAYQQSSRTQCQLERQYDQMISMAEMYDGASLEAKKMIVSQIVERVEVAKGYQLNICIRPEFKEFFSVPVLGV